MNELDQKRNSGGAREFGWEREPEWRTKVGDILGEYRLHLVSQEKSGNTIEKYIRDVKRFLLYAGSERPEREMVLAYKSSLKEQYQLSSANSMLMAVNHYLKYKGLEECRVSAFRQQRKIFSEESRQLSRKEYERLVLEARKRGMVQMEHILHRIRQTFLNPRAYNQAVHNNFNIMFNIFLQFDVLRQFIHISVYAHTYVSAALCLFQKLCMSTLAAADYRRQKLNPCAFR